MDIALQSGDFSFTELKLLNNCCLYMQVTNVSDITNLAGNMFQPGAYTGQKELLFSKPKELQAIQNKPHYKAWHMWVRLMNKIGTPSGGLHQPLGTWLLPANKLKRRWQSYYNSATATFHQYERTAKQWETKQLIDGHFQVIATQPHWTPTTQDYPGLLQEPSPTFTQLVISIDTFEEFLSTQQTYGLLQNLEMHQTPFEVIQHLNAHPASSIGVSDRSSMAQTMSQCWTLATKSTGILAEGAGPAFGNPSSFRAEAYGILTLILFLEALQTYTHSLIQHITICCDNAGLVRKLNTLCKYKTWFPNQYLTTDIDVIQEILVWCKTLQKY